MPKRKQKRKQQYGTKVNDVEVEEDREGESVGESGLMSMFAEELVEEEEEDVAGEREGTEHEEIEGDSVNCAVGDESVIGAVGDESVIDAVGDESAGEGGKKKLRIAGLYRPPTHEELRTLKETQNLFQSNLMRLQITELLNEVRPSPCVKLDQWLASLRTALMATPSTASLDLSEAVHQLPSKIHYPIHLDASTVKGKFTFRPPVTVKVTGSYLLKTAIKPDLNVDLALHIPEECLQAKDHLNYRYLHKRALYLCHVAAHLRKKKKRCGLKSVEFSLSYGGPLMPLLVLKPEDSPQAQYTIKLHTTIPEAPFKPAKLAPDRNNVRPHALEQLPSSLHSLQPSPPTDLQPTPHYNSLVLSEMGGLERHLSQIYTALQECPAMTDAVMLFRVWARQRGLGQGYGGFTGFHFSMLVVFLLSQRKITAHMSSYQILRVALQTIASSDWSTAGISVATPDPSHPPISSFHAHHSVVFLDSTGLLNLLSHLSLSRYTWLRHEAAISMACLDNPLTDGFKALFMSPVPFEMKFDHLIHISPSEVLYSSITKFTNEGESLLLDRGSWPLPLILERLLPLLSKGLEKRVHFITLQPFRTPNWLISKEPLMPCDSHVTVGVALDPDHAFSILEMGPAADSKEAGAFRAFWGEKSELRRFQDGSINEAVLWGGGSVGERRGVVTEVITHLVNRHAGIPSRHLTSSAGVLHPLISLPHYSHPHQRDGDTSLTVLATGEEQCKRIEDTFTEFSKQLRALKGLPLAITSVQGASPVFCHSSVFPQLPWNGRTPRKMLGTPPANSQSGCLYPSCDFATPPFVPALEVVLQMESSGKWPTELDAISHIKASFYTYLSRALSDQYNLLCSPTLSHLDVLKNGYVFRLRIHYHRELSTLRDLISTAKPHEATDLKKRLTEMERQLVDRPLLTSILHGLSQQFSTFGPGVRLCKRWVSSHMLTNHIADEVVELVVARLFLQPEPFTPPNSPECVLLRFLSVFSTHDWDAEPLIVNLNNELSAADMAGIHSRFTSQRNQLPPCYIATPLHRDSSPLTSPAPTLPVLYRTCLLAQESLDLLSRQLTSPDLATIDIKQVFRSPMTGYHVLIHLHKKHLPLAAQAVDIAVTTDSTHSKKSRRGHPTHFPITDFNPVEKYLKELENTFSEFCLFFYDKYGGQCIAVVWKPHAFTPQTFRIMQSFCKTQAAVEKEGKKKLKAMFVPDVKAILSDFELMGEGLVKSIEVLSDPPLNS